MMPSAKLKRRLLAVAALAGDAFGTAWLLWPEPAIGLTNFRRIELGMAKPEIEAVIGLPPGGGYNGNVGGSWPTHEAKGVPLIPRSGYDQISVWWGTKYCIVVAFDKSGTAVGCELSAKSSVMLTRIRTQLGL